METKLTKAKPLTRTKTAEVARAADGHLFVDVKRPDYSTYRVASSAGLTRLLKSILPDRNLLLMTAFRGSRSKTQNERMFEQIPGELRSMLGTKRIGAYWLVGHWTDYIQSLNGRPRANAPPSAVS